MPAFKKLTPENWGKHDDTGSHIVNINLNTGIESTPTGRGWAEKILEPQLNDNVPEEVKELFEVARGILCYGFYFYPLYTAGSEQLYQVTEAAATH